MGKVSSKFLQKPASSTSPPPPESDGDLSAADLLVQWYRRLIAAVVLAFERVAARLKEVTKDGDGGLKSDQAVDVTSYDDGEEEEEIFHSALESQDVIFDSECEESTAAPPPFTPSPTPDLFKALWPTFGGVEPASSDGGAEDEEYDPLSGRRAEDQSPSYYMETPYFSTPSTPAGGLSASASMSSMYSPPPPPSRSDSTCSCLSCQYPINGYQRRSSRLNEGVCVTDFYRFDEVLGEGTFSIVYLAESKVEPDGWVAIKVIEKQAAMRILGKDLPGSGSMLEQQEEYMSYLIDKEIAIMSVLDHAHIVHLNEVYDEDDTVCFVIELAKGGEVFDRLIEHGNFGENQTAALIVQLLCAVNYIHEKGIVHRDLKLENLLYYDDAEDSKILVADFGLSEWILDINEASPICGTPGYMAPEVISEKIISPAADVWSIGVITYILLAGYPPFVPPNDADDMAAEDKDLAEAALLKMIVRGRFRFHSHSWARISEEAKDFIRHLMCVDPQKRLTCEEALDHPWLRSSQSGRHYKGTGGSAGAEDGSGWYVSWGHKLSLLTSAVIIACSYIGVITYLFQLDTWFLGSSPASVYDKVVRNLRTNATVRHVCDYMAKNYFFEVISAAANATTTSAAAAGVVG